MTPSGALGALARVVTVRVPHVVISETASALREFGRSGSEGFALWVGTIVEERATITGYIVPPQNAIQSEDGVGYFVDTATLFAINRRLNADRLRMIAQIHSHPTEAYHSRTDDEYAVVTTEGGFSLVVPYFARGPAVLAAWAVYRLRARRWTQLGPAEIEKHFVVE